MATNEDVVPAKVESQWYQALFEEDCIAVMKLLDAHPSLVKVGWESEPSRQVGGRKRREGTGRTQSSWKGRTALYVGASRGCVKLIMQVLRLCNLDGFSEVNEAYERSLLDQSRADTLSNRAQAAETRDSNPDELSSMDYLSDMDCGSLLLAKDGESGLDALAIAVLHNKKEIVYLLKYCAGKLQDENHYIDISIDAKEASLIFSTSDTEYSEKRKLLRQATVVAVTAFINAVPYWDRQAFDEHLKLHDASTQSFSLDEFSDHYILREYFEHRDFNFLPPEEYLFHFLYACRINWIGSGMRELLWMAVRSWQGDDRFLLELKDGQGRPPFHVAIDESTQGHLLQLLLKETQRWEVQHTMVALVLGFAMTAPDEAGRTPVHRAAATGRREAVSDILSYGGRIHEVSTTCHAYWQSNVDDEGSSRAHGFPLEFPRPHTPLHAAIINKHFSCAELLLEHSRETRVGNMPYNIEYPYKVGNTMYNTEYSHMYVEWDIVELATLVGASVPPTFFDILKDDLAKPRSYKEINGRRGKREHNSVVIVKHQCHPLHLAASSGRYDMVKCLIDELKCDPFVEDFEGNSALHHAMKMKDFELGIHLLDYVNAEHYTESKHNEKSWMAKEGILDDNRIAERQGCINLLLRAGCDIFKINNKKQIPYPTGSLKDKKFLSWWFEKQEKEFTASQNNLNFATNAIAVTAALVATTSYVGPLQPPLGYDANHIQYSNVWVSTFIVCDTLSFYLAIVAITLSLIPSLPMPQQAMLEELQRTRGMVILAVGILLPSIFFVFLAFACSSISVMSANITSEVGGILTIVTTVIGIVLCVWAFLLFSIRFFAFIYPKNTWIRHVYNLSDIFTKFSVVSVQQ